MRGIFVTGTDTNIGKTIVSAALACALRETENVCFWKPIQTGIEEDNDTETVRKLANCSAGEIFDQGVRLEKPLSPHLSARLAGAEISVANILGFLDDPEKFLIVEGAGGVLVPLNESELMIDLMKALDLPVVVVARSALGTINHTLLTLEALRRRNLKILGVVMNGEFNDENRKAVEHYGGVRVLAQMPKFETLEFEGLSRWTSENLCL